nr:T9SS type A sorting domain-containing protein [Bacteroidota bacterium]
ITAYPNPFNPETTVRVKLPSGVRPQESSLMIFNMLGQMIRKFDIASASQDRYSEYVWNGMSDEGKKVSSGVYFAVLRTPLKHHTVKLLLAK